jgi:hypothetical protein
MPRDDAYLLDMLLWTRQVRSLKRRSVNSDKRMKVLLHADLG